MGSGHAVIGQRKPTKGVMHDLVSLHGLHGRITYDMQHWHIFAISSSNATKGRALARTVCCHEGADAVANARIAVCSICSIQVVGASLPLKTSFRDEVEKGEFIFSRYPEDGLEAKLALPLHDIATDKGISGDLDSSLLQKQSTA